MLPNYDGGSLVNLVASIVAARGGNARHRELDALPARELSGARNVVLLIVDGLGDRYLRTRGAGGELARRRRASLTSVFPSTTASAITTSYTGCTPLEHGLTGWFTYFGEAGCVAAALPFRSRGDLALLSARGVTTSALYSAASIFPSLAARSIVVSYREIIDSQYNVRHCEGAERRAYQKLAELVEEVEAAVKSGPEKKFVYAYWPEYDAVSHRHGSESAEAFARFSDLDGAFGTLMKRLAGTETAIVATADHGFIDVTREDCLELPAELLAMLRFPLCGERRVAYCHVHSPAEFRKKAQDWLGNRGDARMSGELVGEGWFGSGTPHPRLAERVGDVTLVMNERFTVKDWLPGEPRHLHIGNHGGTSEDEMTIPLIVENA
ncbi:MAG TPA: alkaline phosphatase family protein [Burkholderiales bacterium]